MLYPVELWDQTIPHDPSASGTWLQRWARLVKLPTSWHKKRDCRAVPFLCLAMSNQLPVDMVEVLLPRFFLDFVLSSAAAAPFEQQPAALSLLQEAPLASAEAPDLLQHEPEAALDLSQEALSLLHDVLLASLAQVCSVLALLSAGASVDWADAVKAKMANAPRKRNFFIVLLSFIDRRKHQIRCSVGKIQTPSTRIVVPERISLFLPSARIQKRVRPADCFGEVAEW